MLAQRQAGDYVFGDGNFDDIITRLMEEGASVTSLWFCLVVSTQNQLMAPLLLQLQKP